MTEQRRFTNSNDDETTYEDEPITWVNYRIDMKEDDGFQMDFDRASYKSDAGSHNGECFFLFNDTQNTGISVWITQHPESLYPVGVTDGQRLGNAVLRALKEKDLGVHEMIDRVNMCEGGSLIVRKATLSNGHWAWRWEVKLNSPK